mgnify:CR=1 FL=1
MKSYLSIMGASKAPHAHCYAFVKYDGSNIRCAWSPKRGWYKFGTRKLMIDETNQYFGKAVTLFQQKYGDELAKVFKKDKQLRNCQEITVFSEWFGENSICGQHQENDKKDIVLFDINVHKKGFMSPKEFVETVGHLPVAELVYQGNLNTELILAVRSGSFDCNSKYPIKNKVPEGLVCKGGDKHNLWMAKLKTEVWFEALRKYHPVDWEKLEQEDS